MGDDRQFDLESPRSQKMASRSKPKMGKVSSKKKGPELSKQRTRKKPRSTYVEKDEEDLQPKSRLVAGFGSKLQLVLFIFVLVVFGLFLYPSGFPHCGHTLIFGLSIL